jgi:hypothetical protein
MKEIRIVRIGNYIGAVKLGRCPMYSITTPEQYEDWKKSLQEDFPDYRITQGEKKERANLAQFIIRQNQR